MRILATVGSTRFDEWVQVLLQRKTWLEWAQRYIQDTYPVEDMQVWDVTIQCGHSAIPQPCEMGEVDSDHPLLLRVTSQLSMRIHVIRFLYGDGEWENAIRNADFVLSHAGMNEVDSSMLSLRSWNALVGSGSILEALRHRKRILVVVNDSLMDNHQRELATEMERSGYLTTACVQTFQDKLQVLGKSLVPPLLRPNRQAFPRLLEQQLGYKF